MLFLGLAAAALALLVWVGRRPILARTPWRLAGVTLAAAAAAAAVWLTVRGGWEDGLILLALAGYLVFALRTPQPTARPAPSSQTMSASDARSTLGVAEGASRAEIEAAYRRLMLRVHPDHGGAPGLAVQLNAARERLLG
ncbi:MAG: J domain-containing protein [Caulobacterales bacterium]